MAAAAEQVTAEPDILSGGWKVHLASSPQRGTGVSVHAGQKQVLAPERTKHHRVIFSLKLALPESGESLGAVWSCVYNNSPLVTKP